MRMENLGPAVVAAAVLIGLCLIAGGALFGFVLVAEVASDIFNGGSPPCT